MTRCSLCIGHTRVQGTYGALQDSVLHRMTCQDRSVGEDVACEKMCWSRGNLLSILDSQLTVDSSSVVYINLHLPPHKTG